MPKETKNTHYAVRSGREPGIYTSWNQCKKQIDGFENSRYKGFPTLATAQAFMGSTAPAITTEKPYQKQAKRRIRDENRIQCSERLTPFPMTTVTQRITDPTQKTIVYTDGACSKNGRASAKGGIGVYFGPDSPLNISEPLTGPNHTNNRAELTAIIRAIQIYPFQIPLLVYSDSMYCIDGLNKWLSGWKNNGWLKKDGEPVLNKDLWLTLDTLRLESCFSIEIVMTYLLVS